MNESQTRSDSDAFEDLFTLRQKLEGLTKRYVEKLKEASQDSEEHARMLTAVLDSVGDALIVFDKDENVVLGNRVAMQITGWESEPVSRADIAKKYNFYKDEGKTLFPPEQQPYAVARHQKKATQVEGFVLGGKLGPEGMWIRSIASPVIDDKGDVVGVVTLFSDITERRRLQKQRDTLATLITHDVKNYLVAESAFLEMLKDDLEGSLDKEQLEFLSQLRKGNKQFLEISSTLLEIYRADLFAVESFRGKIDTLQLLESVLKLNAHSATLRGIELKVNKSDHLPALVGIASALQQVLHNLVQNAVDVSSKGDTVEVNVTGHSKSVVFEIKDQGPGMPAEQVQSLFAASKVASSFRSSVSSTGFGLYLCRLLVDAHGGEISCESKVGAGTTFRVNLPAAVPERSDSQD